MLCFFPRSEYRTSQAINEQRDSEFSSDASENPAILVAVGEQTSNDIEKTLFGIHQEQFSSVVAHDLRAPLRKIATFGEQLLTSNAERLDDRGRDYLDRMLASSRALDYLLESLLELGLVAASAPDLKQVNLGAIVEIARADIHEIISDLGVVVEVSELPGVRGDQDLLRKLFSALLRNSIRFHSVERQLTINISAEERGDGVVEVAVKDNGIGFENDQAEQIFDPLVRLHGRASYGGAGLGLTLCRQIVQIHGGTISASGEVDRGAVFLVKMSLA